MKGNIHWYDTTRGYGFIHSIDGKDVFFHRTSIPSNISFTNGDEVEFEIELSQYGLKAKNVKKT